MAIRNVFDTITSFETLLLAEQHSAKGKRYSNEVLQFRNNLEENILDIQKSIITMQLTRVSYRSFYVYVPKVRKVIYVDYGNKLIERAIYDVINPLVCRTFITDTYSCIEGRGQLKAMQRLYGWLKYLSRKEKVWYYYKFDISKFFYRMDHEILMNICKKKIDDARAVKLIRHYVCDGNIPFGLPLGADPLTITEDEMLWDKGIPIGGGLSHMLANMYMDPLDQYCKRKLGIKYYIRYMDDFIILDDSKERLHYYRSKIEQFLDQKLQLSLNNKTALRPIRCGVEFVGCNIYPDHVNIKKQTTLRIKRRLSVLKRDYQKYNVSLEKVSETVNSYKALLKHVDCKNFNMKLWDEFVLTHNQEESCQG